MRTTLGLALTLALSLTACGGGGDPIDAAYDALSDKRYEDAVASLDEGIPTLDKASTDYRDAVLTRCQALVHIDAKKAADAFIASDVEWEPKEYSKLIAEFYSVKGFLESLPVLDKGLKKYGEDHATLSQLLTQVKAESEKSGGEALNAALAGMGYL